MRAFFLVFVLKNKLLFYNVNYERVMLWNIILEPLKRNGKPIGLIIKPLEPKMIKLNRLTT